MSVVDQAFFSIISHLIIVMIQTVDCYLHVINEENKALTVS